MIAHFDVDAFYASVEQRDDPLVRGKPLAIAGSSRRAVVLTASYEARPFGVRSAMPLYRARELCPQLIVRPPDFARYRASSQAIFAIFAEGARAIEGLSLDEAFADLASADAAAAVAFATEVRRRIRAEIGLTVSAGVAGQKLLAKIASDDAKPDGLRLVEPGCERAYLAPLDIGRLWGIGPKTRTRLVAAGITTIGALARLGDDDIFVLLGRSGLELRELARGNDTRTVDADRETRSVSSEETFEVDLVDGPALRAALRELVDDVARRLSAAGLRGATVGIKVRRADRSLVGRQTRLAVPTDRAGEILAAASLCLDRAGLGRMPVRLLGVLIATLDEAVTQQLSLLVHEAAPGVES